MGKAIYIFTTEHEFPVSAGSASLFPFRKNKKGEAMLPPYKD
jgi:hypothetical protein